MGWILNLAAFLAAIGSGLVAGMFFAFSNFVMAALARLPSEQGVAAMQSIDMTVYNFGFMLVFMGTAAAYLALAAASQLRRAISDRPLLLASALAYLVGCIGVTAAFNLPLNELLAMADPGSPEANEIWSRYLDEWTFWNHVRTAAALTASVGLMLVLIRRAGVCRAQPSLTLEAQLSAPDKGVR